MKSRLTYEMQKQYDSLEILESFYEILCSELACHPDDCPTKQSKSQKLYPRTVEHLQRQLPKVKDVLIRFDIFGEGLGFSPENFKSQLDNEWNTQQQPTSENSNDDGLLLELIQSIENCIRAIPTHSPICKIIFNAIEQLGITYINDMDCAVIENSVLANLIGKEDSPSTK
jgi:hypothetical protein